MFDFLCFLLFFLSGKVNDDQDKLKEELKNIIDDLNNNLNLLKQQVAQQAKQINQLQHEKDALGQKLKEMQVQAANNRQLKDNIAKLQQQLKRRTGFIVVLVTCKRETVRKVFLLSRWIWPITYSGERSHNPIRGQPIITQSIPSQPAQSAGKCF